MNEVKGGSWLGHKAEKAAQWIAKKTIDILDF